MNNFTDRLLKVTENCREDMHEPDEQGIEATVTGYRLDNAMGEFICVEAVKGGYQEFVVTLFSHRKDESFNLASLIALARIGAKTEEGKRIFGN